MTQSSELVSAAFRNSSIGMAIIRADGIVVHSNAAFSEISGHESAEGKPVCIWDLIAREDRSALTNHLRTLTRAGERCSWTVRAG